MSESSQNLRVPLEFFDTDQSQAATPNKELNDESKISGVGNKKYLIQYIQSIY